MPIHTSFIKSARKFSSLIYSFLGNNMEDRIEITSEELFDNKEKYKIIDIRNEDDFTYGSIPFSINIPEIIFIPKISELDKTGILEYISEMFYESAGINNRSQIATKPNVSKVLLVCRIGRESVQLADTLREKGIEAYSLKGGYADFVLKDSMRLDKESGFNNEKNFLQKIETDLITKYRKQIFSRFTKAVNDYELIKEGDIIACCMSGGKDSFLMAKLLQELKKHGNVKFNVIYLCMDPGYAPENRALIESNAKNLGIDLNIFESDIFDNVFHIEKNPCYICARMRRGFLYKEAKERGANKIALGHHYDDVIETVLMGMLYGGQFQTMMPKLHSNNFEGMELIRPLYLIREDDIKKWRDDNGLHFLRCACHFTDTCSVEGGDTSSKRIETKRLIRELKKTNPFVEKNIFKSTENVNLKTIIAYKEDGVKHSFLDEY